MMGCFFPCFSSLKNQRTLSRHKLTFNDPEDVSRQGGAVKILPRVESAEESAGPAVGINLTEDSKVLEEKNGGGVGKNVATVCGDSVDAMKEGKQMDSSRERESIPALADPISRELSSSDGDTSVEEESSDSLFSISIESTDHSCRGVIADKEVSSPVWAENPDKRNAQSRRFGLVDSAKDKCPGTVLNPVENLLPSRSQIGRSTSPLKNHPKEENKENADGLPENILRPSLKLPDCVLKPSSLRDSPQIRDISVDDASLSSWLIESDSTPESQRSVGSFRYSPLQIMLA